MKWQDRISIRADGCQGKACIEGRRVMVSVIFASLAEGDSPEVVMANNHLEPEDIQAAMLFAADIGGATSCLLSRRSPDAVQARREKVNSG